MDALPKFICSNCWQKTEEFHQFHRDVQRAQEKFLGENVKREIEENDVVDETQEHQLTFCSVQEMFLSGSEPEPMQEIVTEMAPETEDMKETHRIDGIDLALKTEFTNNLVGEFNTTDSLGEFICGFGDHLEHNSMRQMEGKETDKIHFQSMRLKKIIVFIKKSKMPSMKEEMKYGTTLTQHVIFARWCWDHWPMRTIIIKNATKQLVIFDVAN